MHELQTLQELIRQLGQAQCVCARRVRPLLAFLEYDCFIRYHANSQHIRISLVAAYFRTQHPKHARIGWERPFYSARDIGSKLS